VTAPKGIEVKVRAAAQQGGVGTALLDAARAEAQQQGCLRLTRLNRGELAADRRRFDQAAGWQERASMANAVYRLRDAVGSQPPVDEEAVP